MTDSSNQAPIDPNSTTPEPAADLRSEVKAAKADLQQAKAAVKAAKKSASEAKKKVKALKKALHKTKTKKGSKKKSSAASGQ